MVYVIGDGRFGVEGLGCFFWVLVVVLEKWLIDEFSFWLVFVYLDVGKECCVFGGCGCLVGFVMICFYEYIFDFFVVFVVMW